MKIKKVFFIIFLYLSSSINLYSIEPDIFVQSTVNRASKTLSENLTREEKIDQLKKIAIETVDIRGIGFYTLGPIRKTLTEDQKKNIQSYLKNTFLKLFQVDCQNTLTLKLMFMPRTY